MCLFIGYYEVQKLYKLHVEDYRCLIKSKGLRSLWQRLNSENKEIESLEQASVVPPFLLFSL